MSLLGNDLRNPIAGKLVERDAHACTHATAWSNRPLPNTTDSRRRWGAQCRHLGRRQLLGDHGSMHTDQVTLHPSDARICRIADVAYSHAYALFGMFTHSLEFRPLSR